MPTAIMAATMAIPASSENAAQFSHGNVHEAKVANLPISWIMRTPSAV